MAAQLRKEAVTLGRWLSVGYEKIAVGRVVIGAGSSALGETETQSKLVLTTRLGRPINFGAAVASVDARSLNSFSYEGVLRCPLLPGAIGKNQPRGAAFVAVVSPSNGARRTREARLSMSVAM
jgi:hypothetical protein